MSGPEEPVEGYLFEDKTFSDYSDIERMQTASYAYKGPWKLLRRDKQTEYVQRV